jgi:hypothetical protein
LGRLPGPTLWEKLLFEVFREDTDGVREEIEDANEVLRGAAIPDLIWYGLAAVPVLYHLLRKTPSQEIATTIVVESRQVRIGLC